MLNYLVNRLFTSIIVVIGVCSIVFLLIHLVPGDPVEVMLGESASPADRETLRRQLGLDQPLHRQWLLYLQDVARLDMGMSIHSRRPVTSLLAERLPATFILAVASIVVAVLIAIPAGIMAALRKNTLYDHVSMTVAMVGVAIPNFWLGPLLVLLFSFYLGWFPVSGMTGPLSLVLPAVTLGTALAALQSRMIRASLLEVLGENYIVAARARGLGEARVVLGHAMRNALLPVTTVLGAQLGALLTGAVVTEQIFDWPGLGLLTIEAIQKRDYPVLQGCILLISIIYVIINLLTDLVYVVLDPRVRLDNE
jgi:peptide/nickel transport system permease protein